MASGVSVQEICKEEFGNIKLGHKYRYIVYRLGEDLREIEVEKTAPPCATYEDFLVDLNNAKDLRQCRYAIYDAEYVVRGQKKSKLVFFYWSPEESTTKQKMVYSASKEKFRSELGTGISNFVQANDEDDILWENVMERLLSNDRYS